MKQPNCFNYSQNHQYIARSHFDINYNAPPNHINAPENILNVGAWYLACAHNKKVE